MPVISFPSQIIHLSVISPVARDTLAGVFFNLVIVAPITLLTGDTIAMDIRTGTMELVERRGIVIWRHSWRN